MTEKVFELLPKTSGFLGSSFRNTVRYEKYEEL